MSRKRRELQQLTIDGGHEVVAVLDKQPDWGGRRRGAGRPKTSDKVYAVTCRITAIDMAILDKMAGEQSRPRSAIAAELLRNELAKVPLIF